MLTRQVGQSLLACRGLGLRIAGRELLRDLDLDLRSGELLAVTGPSGCGKSTLLRVLAGLDPLRQGSITLACARRGEVAVAFQDAGLPGSISGLQAILAGRLHALPWWSGCWSLPAAGVADARVWAERLGIAHLLGRPVATASGGERQRLAIARALHHGGRVVLLDEPVSQLDPGAARLVMDCLRQVAAEGQRAVLAVVHQPELVTACADRELAFTGDGGWTLREVGDGA